MKKKAPAQRNAPAIRPANLPPNHPDAATGDGEIATAKDLIAIDYISQLLTQSAFDIEMVLQEIVRTTAEQMQIKASALRLIDTETGGLVLQAVHGLSERFLTEAPTFDTESRFQQLIESGGIFEIIQISDDPDLQFSKAALNEGICSLLAVGLYRDDGMVGALSVYTAQAHAFTPAEIRVLKVIANQAAVAIQLAQLHQSQLEKEALEQRLALAAEIQNGVLPTEMPNLSGMRMAARARSWEQVGGDFFDFISLPLGNLGIAIGDVSGKGIPAALLMFTVRMALRAHVEHEYALREIMYRVNKALYRDTMVEQFATLFYGVINVPGLFFTYVNASQNPPLLFRGDEILRLENGGLPVGMLPDATYQEDLVSLEPGDLLVFYTDGFSEVSSPDEDIFGEDRLCEVILAHRDVEPEQLIDLLEEAVTTFMGHSQYGDDRTMVVLKVEESA